jgi:Bacteriophage T4-like portal protein (Gp20)
LDEPLATPSTPLLPTKQQGFITRFGAVVQAVRALVGWDTEQPPLQIQTSSEAEARGFGNTPVEIDSRTLAGWAYERMKIEAGRFAAMRDYELMDSESPEVSSALDVIAEFSTQADDPLAETFTIESEDQALEDTLNEVVRELKLDQYITPIAREVAKHGGTFLELIANEDGEIIACKPLPSQTIIRNEDPYGRLLPEAFTQIDPQSTKPVAKFAAWQIVHFRYQKISSRMYGNSLLESARKLYKQLALMEDGMVVGRLYRSHLRYCFSLPVEGMTKEQIFDYIDEMKAKFKKKMRFNVETGRVEQFDSPMTAEEDFWLPAKKEIRTDVKVLQGQGNLSQIGDVEYFQNKLFASIKVPKAILGFERDVNAKATLSTQDVNFARTLRRIQQVLSSGVREVLTRVMILEGVDVKSLKSKWHPAFPSVSTTDELVQWQTELIKSQVAEVYKLELGVIDDQYIYTKFLDLSDEEIARLKTAVAAQKAQDQADAMALAQATPAAPIVKGDNVKPAAPKGPPDARSKKPSKDELRIVRRVRTLLQQDVNEIVKDEELKMARLMMTTTQRFKALLESGTLDKDEELKD